MWHEMQEQLLPSENRSPEWVDNGATRHITFCKDYFFDFVKVKVLCPKLMFVRLQG